MSLLYMFQASKYPSSGENYFIHATLILVTLDDLRLFDQTPLIQCDKYQCRMDTVIFS